jgi:hypothetical protein
VRFVPRPNLEISKEEAATIFSHLNFVKNGGELKEWCLVVEEAHRFASDANLRDLLIEGRKFCRTVFLVTTDFREFSGITEIFKPRLWKALTVDTVHS